MTTRLEFKAGEADALLRADIFLARESGLTRSTVIRLMEDGQVTLGGSPVRKNHRIAPNEIFVVLLPAPRESGIKAQDIPLEILYEDADMLVINKPRGMVVHPAAGHSEGTLVNALLMHCGDSLSGIGGVDAPGHRAPARPRHERADACSQERFRPCEPCRADQGAHRPARI